MTPTFSGRVVMDWQVAKAALQGSTELVEIATKARLIRLLNATDAVAWALSDTWAGRSSYPSKSACAMPSGRGPEGSLVRDLPALLEHGGGLLPSALFASWVGY